MHKILLAEDNPADVYLIRAALQEHGVELPTEVASDGREVLQFLQQEETLPSTTLKLIILDLNLPRHDGIEILQWIRSAVRVSTVPVAVLTSSDSPRDRTLALELGATRVLRKPSNLEQFLSLGSAFKELVETSKTQTNGV